MLGASSSGLRAARTPGGSDTTPSVARMNSKAAELRVSMAEEPVSPANSSKPPPPARINRSVSSAHASGRRGFGRIGGSEATTDAGQLASDYEVIRHRYEDVLKENEMLKGEQKRRMESYMRRETAYQAEVEDLKAEIERQAKARPPEDVRMAGLRNEHQKVMDRLTGMQKREALSLQEQEKDLLRAFRARLWDVQFELETERSKKDDGALEWIEKTKTLGKVCAPGQTSQRPCEGGRCEGGDRTRGMKGLGSCARARIRLASAAKRAGHGACSPRAVCARMQELDWSREEALRLDRTNQFLTHENARLKTQLKQQDDDREFIVRQVRASGLGASARRHARANSFGRVCRRRPRPSTLWLLPLPAQRMSEHGVCAPTCTRWHALRVCRVCVVRFPCAFALLCVVSHGSVSHGSVAHGSVSHGSSHVSGGVSPLWCLSDAFSQKGEFAPQDSVAFARPQLRLRPPRRPRPIGLAAGRRREQW